MDGAGVGNRGAGRVGSDGGGDTVSGDAHGGHPGASRLSAGAGDFDLSGRLAGVASHSGDDESRRHGGSDVVGRFANASFGDSVSGQPLAGLTCCRQDSLVDSLVDSRVVRLLYRIKSSVDRRVCRVYCSYGVEYRDRMVSR